MNRWDCHIKFGPPENIPTGTNFRNNCEIFWRTMKTNFTCTVSQVSSGIVDVLKSSVLEYVGMIPVIVQI